MRSGQDRSRWVMACSVDNFPHVLTVEAEDGAGNIGSDSIELEHSGIRPHAPVGDGSDADTIGPWSAKHILGTQLGPNRNGRPW
jgi:Icc protein